MTSLINLTITSLNHKSGTQLNRPGNTVITSISFSHEVKDSRSMNYSIMCYSNHAKYAAMYVLLLVIILTLKVIITC